MRKTTADLDAVRTRMAALAALALLSAPGRAAEGPRVCTSILWEPYAYDGLTSALFHFDDGKPVSIDAVMDGIGEDVAGTLLAPDASTAGAANAAPMGQPLTLKGNCAVKPDAGRFGGGLRFQGGDGVAFGTVPTGPRTVEFWVRPDELPTKTVALAAVGSGAGRPAAIALRMQPDGAIGLQWGEQSGTASNATLAAGEWTHLALVWGGHSGGSGTPAEPSECRVNGMAAVFPYELSGPEDRNATALAIGNDFEGKSGFHGVVDELRISGTIRKHFPWILGWTDRDGRLDRPETRPYFMEPSEPLLRLDFDRTLKPAMAPDGMTFPELGPDQPGDTVEPDRWMRHFAEGVRREAVLLKPDGVEATYEGRGFVLPERGTLAFWVRPLTGAQPKSVPLFRALQAGEKEPVMALGLLPAPLNLHPGRWVHLAVTWDGKRETWYADGNPLPNGQAFAWARRGWDAGKPLTLVFDWAAETKSEPASGCAIDDFRIYPRPLGRLEVRNLAALFDRRVELEPLPTMDMTIGYNGVIGYVDVALQPLHPETPHAVAIEVMVVSTKQPREPLILRQFDLRAETEPRARLDTGPLPFGDFVVRAEAHNDRGEALFAAEKTFTREPPPWWGNRIGVSEKVMPGWEAIRCQTRCQEDIDQSSVISGQSNGAVVGVSLRDIHLAASGLPEKIVSVGEDILDGPVELTAAAGGKPEALEPVAGSFRVETQSEVRADFSGRSVGGGVTADVKGYVEFDGFMWFEVTLITDHRSPITLSSLSLRIPYAADASKLLHWWSGARGFRNPKVVHIGATPPGQGRVFSSLDREKVALYDRQRGSFMPYVMLTGDRCGMAWFGENDQGWTTSMETPAVSIERQGETVTLVLNIITEPVSLDEPRTVAFGLLPTPVKPVDPDWRITPYMGMWPDSFEGFNLKGAWGQTDNWRHPENMDWELANRRYRGELGGVWNAADRVNQSIMAFRAAYGRDPQGREERPAGIYADLTYINAFPDDTREWGETFPAWRYTPELNDYWAWIWDLWLKKTPVRGIYVDDTFNDPRDSAPSVAYQRADGGMQPGFQWRQIREHLKRTRQVFLDNGLRPNLCAHSTHTLFVPYHSFFDTVLDGEDFYKGAGDKRDFMDSWSPERLRFMHPERWGMAVHWLRWFGGPGEGWERFPELRWRQWRAYTAALLVHDQVWGVQSHQLDLKWIQNTRLQLDTDITFVGYWDDKAVAIRQQDGLYISTWRRNGWCAVALANWRNDRLEAQVELDLAVMGLAEHSPDSLAVRDVDSNLITYIDDPRKIKPPDLPDGMGVSDVGSTRESEELTLDEPLTLAQRKAAEPDAQFAWENGILRCPVRRHDFRLFEFVVKEDGR